MVYKRMISLDTDYSGLNKFGGVDDENLRRVLPEIQRMVECGASIVAIRHGARGKESLYIGTRYN